MHLLSVPRVDGSTILLNPDQVLTVEVADPELVRREMINVGLLPEPRLSYPGISPALEDGPDGTPPRPDHEEDEDPDGPAKGPPDDVATPPPVAVDTAELPEAAEPPLPSCIAIRLRHGIVVSTWTLVNAQHAFAA